MAASFHQELDQKLRDRLDKTERKHPSTPAVVTIPRGQACQDDHDNAPVENYHRTYGDISINSPSPSQWVPVASAGTECERWPTLADLKPVMNSCYSTSKLKKFSNTSILEEASSPRSSEHAEVCEHGGDDKETIKTAGGEDEQCGRSVASSSVVKPMSRKSKRRRAMSRVLDQSIEADELRSRSSEVDGGRGIEAEQQSQLTDLHPVSECHMNKVGVEEQHKIDELPCPEPSVVVCTPTGEWESHPERFEIGTPSNTSRAVNLDVWIPSGDLSAASVPSRENGVSAEQLHMMSAGSGCAGSDNSGVWHECQDDCSEEIMDAQTSYGSHLSSCRAAPSCWEAPQLSGAADPELELGVSHYPAVRPTLICRESIVEFAPVEITEILQSISLDSMGARSSMGRASEYDRLGGAAEERSGEHWLPAAGMTHSSTVDSCDTTPSQLSARHVSDEHAHQAEDSASSLSGSFGSESECAKRLQENDGHAFRLDDANSVPVGVDGLDQALESPEVRARLEQLADAYEMWHGGSFEGLRERVRTRAYYLWLNGSEDALHNYYESLQIELNLLQKS